MRSIKHIVVTFYYIPTDTAPSPSSLFRDLFLVFFLLPIFSIYSIHRIIPPITSSHNRHTPHHRHLDTVQTHTHTAKWSEIPYIAPHHYHHDNKKIYFAYPSNGNVSWNERDVEMWSTPLCSHSYAVDCRCDNARHTILCTSNIQKENTRRWRSVESFHNFHNQIDEVDLPEPELGGMVMILFCCYYYLFSFSRPSLLHSTVHRLNWPKCDAAHHERSLSLPN